MAADSLAKASTHEKVGPGPLWKTPGLQLPAYIQHIANDLREKRGMDTSRAIATAVAACKRWAAGGGNVDANTQAAARKALAEWEAAKATARSVHASVVTRAAIELGTWDEAAHPRVAAGQTGGGEFTTGNGGSGSGSSTAPAKGAAAKPAAKGAGKTNAAAQALWDRMSTMTPAQQAAYLKSLSPAQLQALGGAAFAPGQAIAPGMVAARTLVANELSSRGLTIGTGKAAAGAKKAAGKSSAKKSSGSKKSSSGGSSSGKSSGSSGSSKSSGSGSSSKASSSKSSSAAAKAAAEKKAAAAKTAAQKKAAAAVAKAAAAQAAAATKAAAAKTAADKKAAAAAAKAAAAQAKQAAAAKKAADAAAAAAAKAAAPKFASPRSAGSTSSKVGVKKVLMSSGLPAIQLSYAPPAFSKGNQAPAKPAAKPADKPDPAKAPAHIPNIAALRGAMGSFGRVPPPQRAARLADIRAAAEALGASSLEWVRSFLATNGTPPRQTPPQPA